MIKIYILLMLAVFFWSGNFVVARFIHDEIHPLLLAYIRWLGVFALLVPYGLLRIKLLIKLIKSSFTILLFLGVLGIGGFNTLLYYGLQYTTATNALLINSSIPILIVIINSILFKEKISPLQFLGVILSTIGVILLVTKGDLHNLLSFQFNLGDLFIILSSLVWALYSIFLKFKPQKIESLDFFATTVFFGVIFLSFLILLSDYSFKIEEINFKNEVWYSVTYMVLLPSFLSYFFWNIGVDAIGANKAGQFTHLMPIFGSAIAYFFLKEEIYTYHLIGIAFIAFGIYLALFLKRSI